MSLRALAVVCAGLASVLPGLALAEQGTCDILKTAVAGNTIINGKPPAKTPLNLVWPDSRSTTVGNGHYTVALFDGSPGEADVRRMRQSIDAADKLVAQCLPSARRLTRTVGADMAIEYCVAGNNRSVTITSSLGNRMISAWLSVEVPPVKTCP
jgi:hypothetical protein